VPQSLFALEHEVLEATGIYAVLLTRLFDIGDQRTE